LKKTHRFQKQVRSYTAAPKKQSGTIELSIDNFRGVTFAVSWLLENRLNGPTEKR